MLRRPNDPLHRAAAITGAAPVPFRPDLDNQVTSVQTMDADVQQVGVLSTPLQALDPTPPSIKRNEELMARSTLSKTFEVLTPPHGISDFVPSLDNMGAKGLKLEGSDIQTGNIKPPRESTKAKSDRLAEMLRNMPNGLIDVKRLNGIQSIQDASKRVKLMHADHPFPIDLDHKHEAEIQGSEWACTSVLCTTWPPVPVPVQVTCTTLTTGTDCT